MRRVEQACAQLGLPPDVLMENAGQAVAREVDKILGGVDKKRILVLVGPGNNGGDGLVAARHLHEGGGDVAVCLCARQVLNDANLNLVKERGITCLDAKQSEALANLEGWLPSADAVIDALFGTGSNRPFRGSVLETLERVNQAREEYPSLRIIAVDLPSGLNADSGVVEDPNCLYADNTITLGLPKPGLYNFPGAERVGRITVADIGIPSGLVSGITTEVITEDWAGSVLPRRPLGANKGTFGKVLAVAGSINYIGAAYLACSGAMRVGTGLVTLATAHSLQPVLAAKLTEATYLPLPESRAGTISAEAAGPVQQEMGNYNVLLLGCGLGQSDSVARLVRSILLGKVALPPVVVDADALNVLAKFPDWWQRFSGEAIFTPHPGEMARLIGVSVSELLADKAVIVRGLASEWNKTVVLKGAYTIIAAPDGRLRISTVANPGLASAGTGDVLSGAIAGLVAQGLPLFDAAALGVYLHAQAGEMVRENLGDAGMIAGDLLPVLPLAIKRMMGKQTLRRTQG